MQWSPLVSLETLNLIHEKSYQKPQVIFKHSSRCSISSMALNRLPVNSLPENADWHLLDLIKHRDISNAIQEKYEVQHESPQVLVIKNGRCSYDESHYAIQLDEIVENI